MNNNKPGNDGKESLKDELIGALHQSVIETQKVADDIETGASEESLPATKPETDGTTPER